MSTPTPTFSESSAAPTKPRRPSPGGDPSILLISLERLPCKGTCPVYKVKIDGKGNVAYEGKDHVRMTGTQTAVIPREKVDQLVALFMKSNYFSMKPAYKTQTTTDSPTVLIAFVKEDMAKQVEHYLGDSSAPPALTELENAIDRAINIGQWTDPPYPTPK